LKILDPSLVEFLNLIFRKPWIVRKFRSKPISTRRKDTIRAELLHSGIEMSRRWNYIKPLSGYGHMIWQLACELVDDFGEQTILGLRANKDRNLKLKIILALDEAHEKRLWEMKRSDTRRFWRDVKRLIDLGILEKIMNGFGIANLDKGKNLARRLSDFQRKMTEDCFMVSVKAEPWYAYGDPEFQRVPINGCECTIMDFRKLDRLIEYLATEWIKVSRNETFYWLFSAFPSPLKKFLNFEIRWPTTGLEAFLQLHSLSRTTLDWKRTKVEPVVPILFPPYRVSFFADDESPWHFSRVCGFGLTCDLKRLPHEMGIGVLKDYFRKFQDYEYCKLLGNMLNQVNAFIRKHGYPQNLSKMNSGIQPFRIRYLRSSLLSYGYYSEIDNYSSKMCEEY